MGLIQYGRVMPPVTLQRSYVVFILLLAGLGVLLLSAVNISQYPGHSQTHEVLLTPDDVQLSAATTPPILDLTVRDQQESNPRQNFAGPNRHLVGLKEYMKARTRSTHVRDNLSSAPVSTVPSSTNGQCPLHKPFLVYVYDSPSPGLERPEVIKSLIEHLQFGSSWTDDPESACVFVFVAGPWRVPVTSDELESMIHSLPHWQRHSSRHVLVELSQSTSTSTAVLQVRTGQALLATSYLPSHPTHMHNHVLASPLLAPLPNVYHPLPPVVSPLLWNKPSPSLYFEGELTDPANYEVNISGLCHQMHEHAQGSVCSIRCVRGREKGALEHEWSLCGDARYRHGMCKKAKFALIPTGEVGPATLTRLLEALQCGAIPVFIGSGPLPFSEVIKWEKAALFLSQEMVPYMTYRLKIITREDLKTYQLQGLFLYKTYFSSQLRIVKSVVALVRHRLQHSPMWYPDYTPQALVTTMPASLTHQYKMTFNYAENVWNSPPGPFYTHTRPSQRHSLLSAMFSATADGISTPDSRTVTDHPSTERYTVVVLTYHRDQALLKMLETFQDCPMLAKVVVVWNNEQRHAEDLSWPNIGVPIEVRRFCVCERSKGSHVIWTIIFF